LLAPTVHAVGNSGAALTIDASSSSGWVKTITLTANCTFTLTGAVAGRATTLELVLTQDATGSRAVTWPASVRWSGGAPTLSTAACRGRPGGVDLLQRRYDVARRPHRQGVRLMARRGALLAASGRRKSAGAGSDGGIPVTPGWWRADPDTAPVGSMGNDSNDGSATSQAVKAMWGFWDMPGASVVNIAGEGLPAAPWGGTRAIKWFKPFAQAEVYQKLSRTFNATNWPLGNNTATTTSPGDVSGRYITWRYIRSADVTINPSHGWLVLQTFKENYNDPGFMQNGTGWKVSANVDDGLRVSMTSKVSSALVPNFTDKWIKLEYRVFQGARDLTGHGGRIEFWVNDVLFDTGYEGDAVEGTPNPTGHVGSAAFVPLSSTLGWIYPIGQYTSDQGTDWQGTQMTSYIGLTGLLPLPS
jgi:hypothetical protein